jgi:hypothetical protein
MEKESTLKFTLNNQVVSMNYSFSTDGLDVDDILRIDHGNILGELLTFPSLMGKIGMMLADAENEYLQAKLNNKITEATLSKTYREKLKAEKLTQAQLEAEISVSDEYVTSQEALLQAQHVLNMIKNFHEACLQKARKLDTIATFVNKSEAEIAEGTINKIKVRAYKSWI